jgi:hypothetical protein
MPHFDKLPTEIYDEVCTISVPTYPALANTSKIFSHLAYELLDYEGVSTRPSIPEDIHTFDFIRGVGRNNFGYRMNRWPRPGDLRLRLVSRAFNRALTRVYFQHEFAIFHACKGSTALFIKERFLSEQSTLVPFVTRLRVQLSFDNSYGSKSIFSKKYEAGDFPNQDVSPAYLVEFFNELDSVVAKLPMLERLVIDINEDWSSSGPSEEDSDFDQNDEVQYGGQVPLLDLELLSRVRNSIANVFSCPSNNLEFLTYLRLTLPCAFDFATIGAHISTASAMRLRHLYLEYIDGTGPGGDLYYTRSWEGEEDLDGDEDYPYSNLQRRVPNVSYARAVCDLMQRCQNLESFGFAGTQCLDFRSLDWRPKKDGLRNLYISRALMTVNSILQLLSSLDTDISKITAFQIEDVRLLDGTWAQIWEHLLKCSSLRYLHIYNLVYDREGESYHLHEHNNRPWENVTEIWSKHEPDKKRLGDLARKVEEQGGSVSNVMQVFENDYESD